MAEKSTHFVKYRVKNSSQSDYYIIFSSEKPEYRREGGRHPLASHLAETDVRVADKVEKLILEMTTHEEQFFIWLGARASHMEYFIKDPAGALRQAIPDLPEAFFNEFNSLPKLIQSRN